jgi:hypothetical protein
MLVVEFGIILERFLHSLLEKTAGLPQHVLFGYAGEFSGMPLLLPLARQLARKFRNLVRALLCDDTHGKFAVAHVCKALSKHVAVIRHGICNIREIALSAGIHPFEIFAHDDEIDPLGVRERRAGTCIVFERAQVGVGFEDVPQVCHDYHAGLVRSAEQYRIRIAAHLARFIGQGGAELLYHRLAARRCLQVEFESSFLQYVYGCIGHFRADAVASEHYDFLRHGP